MKKTGFTLVEVLIVLVILGLSAGLAVPPLLDWADDDRQSGAVGEVLRVARDARMAALRRGVKTRLTIDPASGRYWTTAEEADDPLYRTGRLSLADARIVGTEPRPTVRWDARGRAVGDTIRLQTERGLWIIAADRWTGAPRAHVR